MQHLRLGLILGLTALGASLPSCNKDQPPTNPPADGGAEEGGAEEGGAEEGGAEEGGAEEGAEYDPCAGKSCGDPCSLCPPDDAECVETAVVKQCNAAGECTAEAATCE